MSNFGDDVVIMMPDTPLIIGRASARALYASLLKAGSFDFTHDYKGAEASGEAVFLHGVARGTFTPAGGIAAPFANNFLLVLKKQTDGKYRFARIAVSPEAASPQRDANPCRTSTADHR
jgi:ketosteroid isomerase-like protein